MAEERSALQFILRLHDQATGPMGRVTRTIVGQAQSMAAQVTRATGIMQSGMLLAAGGAFALVGALRPAIAHSRALGEVRSLGVAADAMAHLNRESMRFTQQFGGSATEVVRSAYDIQSAIAGLRGDELARFTASANLAAKATKATAADVTSFFGTAFGIFRAEAEQMGRARWVEQLTGQMSQAVQMFKTTGPQIGAAFTRIGATAQTMGVSMAEQFAVLGTLSATMPGPEAGSRYRALLQGLSKAQTEFGLQFTDSAGRLRSLPDILDMIRPKLAGLSSLQQQGVLQKALGSQEAVQTVSLLLGQSDELQRSIGQLGRIRGLGPAVEMAKAQVDPWMQLVASVRNLSITVGTMLLPVIEPWIARMAEGAAQLREWGVRFPHLTEAIALGTGMIFASAAAVGVLKVGYGLLLFALTPLKPALWAAKHAMWLFNAALWANPMTWVVAGIVALGAALVLAIVYWDDLKRAALAFWDTALNSGFIRGFLNMLNTIQGGLNSVSRWLGFNPDASLRERSDAALETMGIAKLPAAEPLSGEARQALSNVANTDNSRRVHVERLTIEPKEQVGPDYLGRVFASEGMG